MYLYGYICLSQMFRAFQCEVELNFITVCKLLLVTVPKGL